VSVGTEVAGVKETDTIYFDRHAGHKIEVGDNSYHVIKSADVVVVV
jgi:co-chaperonin GroES (HSP10)